MNVLSSLDTFSMMWADALDLPADARGVYVMGITGGGPAAKAGLRGGSQASDVLLQITQRGPQYLPAGGDLITALDGAPATSMDALMAYLTEQTASGQTVRLTVLRAGGQAAAVDMVLAVQPAQVAANDVVG